MFKPHRLGEISIPDDELLIDKKNCRKIGPCGIGEKALYQMCIRDSSGLNRGKQEIIC